MSKSPAWNAEQWFSTTQLLDRGWAREWLGLLLGEPSKVGSAKLWSRQQALQVEAHPVFMEACVQLADLTTRVRYVTKEHQVAALRAAKAKFEAGELPAAAALSIAPIADAPPASGFPKAEWSQDALTLDWECGGRVVIPMPFLEALRQGLGETTERLTLAINTILTDWRLGRIKPEKFHWGRNYFLAAVRNTLAKLQELERQGGQPRSAEDQDRQPRRILH